MNAIVATKIPNKNPIPYLNVVFCGLGDMMESMAWSSFTVSAHSAM
jgi:hypothetical protein